MLIYIKFSNADRINKFWQYRFLLLLYVSSRKDVLSRNKMIFKIALIRISHLFTDFLKENYPNIYLYDRYFMDNI